MAKPITLSVDSNGDITVAPTVTYLKHSDRDGVMWQVDPKCRITRFSIMFGQGTPFSALTFNGDKKNPAPSKGVRQDAPLRSYHYTVAFESEAGIVQVPGCPEIIIQ